MTLTAAQLKTYRNQTYRRTAARRVHTETAALEFVNERGFVYFWPIQGVDLPSLWVAAAGDRPVADRHDDPGHITWGWKDALLGQKKWFYAKVLRGKATLIALSLLPYFYALSENYGDWRHDYLLQYEAGQLTQAARAIFEALLEHGPLDTLALRRAARLAGPESQTRFERALTELQTGFKILPVGVAEAGRWRYAFVYELVDRWYPRLAGQARPIGRAEARARLLAVYLQSVGAATEAQAARLLHWRTETVRQTCAGLAEAGQIAPAAKVAGQAGDWWMTAALAARLTRR